MAQAKDREELKARLQKLTQSENKVEEKAPVQEDEEDNLESLEKQFEERKKALIEKQKQEQETKEEVTKEEAQQMNENVRLQAEERLNNNGVYRFELLVQLVKLNKNIEELTKSLVK